MPERLTKEERSRNMSLVPNKNTKPELIVRRFLHKNGFRFRLHRKDMPGHPDIVLPKYKTVIFVHGCFWHRHEGCRRCTTPVGNADFWQKKFAVNVARDKQVCKNLKESGWRVIVIWECEVKTNIDGKLIDLLQNKKSPDVQL